jgi:hypothetical protein
MTLCIAGLSLQQQAGDRPANRTETCNRDIPSLHDISPLSLLFEQHAKVGERLEFERAAALATARQPAAKRTRSLDAVDPERDMERQNWSIHDDGASRG